MRLFDFDFAPIRKKLNFQNNIKISNFPILHKIFFCIIILVYTLTFK